MSLLSYLYPRIKGSQEDVATLALAYILNQSDAVSAEFVELVRKTLGIERPISERVLFRTQVVEEGKERPDLVGFTSDNRQLFLCEAKFYAALTENQPNGYLKRVHDANGLGLIFICPKARIINLRRHLFDLCPDALAVNEQRFLASYDIPVGLISWMEVLDALKLVAEKESSLLVSDIDQLRDFCKIIDSEEYQPFSEEDFGIDVPKKMERYQVVINKIADKMLDDPSRNASTWRLQGKPFVNGYSKYINSNGYAITLQFNRALWRHPSYADTPFWFSFKKGWEDNAASFLKDLPVNQTDLYPTPESAELVALDAQKCLYLSMDDAAAILLEQIDKLIGEYERKQKEKAGE